MIMGVVKTVVSSKFSRKIVNIESLQSLDEYIHLDQVAIPAAVTEYDSNIKHKNSGKTGRGNKATAQASNVQFGGSLATIMKGKQVGELPVVVGDCLGDLRRRGIMVEGIFRRSASLVQVRQIKELYNSGGRYQFDDETDPHIAAVLLKSFLRDLKEPLLTFSAFDKIVSMDVLDIDGKLECARKIVTSLPKHNLVLLYSIFVFLREVAEKADVNMMSATNLAIVFGPNIAWAKDVQGPQASLMAMGEINNYAYILQDEFDYIFPDNVSAITNTNSSPSIVNVPASHIDSM